MLNRRLLDDDRRAWEIRGSLQVAYDVIETEYVFLPSNETLVNVQDRRPERYFVVLDEALSSYRDLIEAYFDSNGSKCAIIELGAEETNKTFKAFDHVALSLDKFGLERRDEPIVAVGGGVVMDLVGFVASSYRRGVSYIRVPTTLVGYIDAGLGIKTGLNFGGNKNRIGSFTPPLATILDPHFLKSLPARHIRNGMGEILKVAVIGDSELFQVLESSGREAADDKFQNLGEPLLRRSIDGMLRELEVNLYEDVLERAMDFGHTFSPILEMSNLGELLHGEAVAIDIALCTIIAEGRGLLGREERERILRLGLSLSLPVLHKDLVVTVLWESLLERKAHRGGDQRVPLPDGIGRCKFASDLSQNELGNAIERLVDVAPS